MAAPQTPIPDRSVLATRISLVITCTVIALLQVSKLLVYFQDPGHLFDGSKLYHIDYPVMEYQLEVARKFVEHTGSMWGYDPFFLNGYVHSFLWNSNVFLQILSQAFPFFTSNEILKLSLAAIMVVEPFLIYGAMRHFGFGTEARLWATMLTTLYLKVAHPMILLILGMLTAYLLFPLFLYAIAMLYRIATTETSSRMRIAFPGVLALCLLVHKTFLILALPVCIIVGVKLLLNRDTRMIGYMCASFGFAFLVNSFWIWPSMRMQQYVDFSYNAFLRYPVMLWHIDWTFLLGEAALTIQRAAGIEGSLEELRVDRLRDVIRMFLNGTYVITLLLVVLAFAGLISMLRRRSWLLFSIVSLELFGLVFLIAFGYRIKLLENLHGVRFFFGLGIVLSIPMAFFLDSRFRGTLRLRGLVGRGVLLLVVFQVLRTFTFENLFEAKIVGKQPTILQEVPLFAFEPDSNIEKSYELLEWLETLAPSENIFVAHSANQYLYGLFGIDTQLRFINAPYNHIYLKQNWVNRYFQDFFRRGFDPPHAWSALPAFPDDPEQFHRLAEFFNVRWWVIDTEASLIDVVGIDGMNLVKTLGQYQIYRLDRPMGDFLVGSGELSLDYGLMTIRRARPVNGELVVKMNWFDDFEVSGAEAIEPYPHEDLPLPFLKILNPGETVEIRF